MTGDTQPVRAPRGALAWTAHTGFVYDSNVMAGIDAAEAGDLVLMVSDDGYLHGVLPHDRTPLAALLRVEADVDALRRVVADLGARVGDLGDRVEGRDTGEAVELVALKARVRRLEERS